MQKLHCRAAVLKELPARILRRQSEMQRLHTRAAVLKDPSLQHPWGESWRQGLQTSILWCS